MSRRQMTNVVIPLLQAVRSQIAEAQKIASGSGSEQDIAEAKIELEVGRVRFVILRVCLLTP